MIMPTPTLPLRHARLLLLLAACYFCVPTAICSPNPNYVVSFSRNAYTSLPTTTSRSLFSIRGGAFFGFSRSSKQDDGGGGDDDGPKRYPALSQDEIEEKLNIPVFGLTDAHGNGVILSDNGSSIFHFFFSKHMADSALKAVTEANAGAPELKVSAFHLGKCWFKLINKSGSQKYKLQKYGHDVGKGENDVTKAVHFRLVPNMKDLMGARILTGLKPGDVEELKDAVEEPNPPKALSIIQNAAESASSSFNIPFNKIPVFAIAQMRVRKRDEQGNPMGENMMPFHLSTKTMSDTWNEFVHHSPQFRHTEATLQLIELHKMVEMMQSDSDFDFRNCVFIAPSYDRDDQNNDYVDDSDEDSDDGGGGDNGMMADSANYDECSIEPFVTMEIFADTPAQTLVQL
mmetsp:Transcript_27187/g.65370  ORF Transcript_27187/g.65370 Transcript_27187/m.65370 type:complete len:401 (+) Transcript_27187:140-1342(+)